MWSCRHFLFFRIATAYTQIIHIEDLEEALHLNTFEIQQRDTNEVQQYIAAFIDLVDLSGTITAITN